MEGILQRQGVIRISAYKNTRFLENFNVAVFDSVGAFDFPMISPLKGFAPCEFVEFSKARNTSGRENKGLHFYIDDYRFERVWRQPETYIELLSQFQYVMTPDFSMYTDFPKALQIYSHYRKQWLGAYWQSMGINVIPTIGWSTEDSFDWCFEGCPQNAVVSVSSVGTQNDDEAKRLFLAGWNRMMEVLKPETVIFYGEVPEECHANIVRIKSFTEKFTEAKISGR